MTASDGNDRRRVLITGVSSGIGHGLAEAWLERGYEVFGMSRRTPSDLIGRDGFHFVGVDLTDFDAIATAMSTLLAGVESLDCVVLNAGVHGRYGDMTESDIEEMQATMAINTWANKAVLDALLEKRIAMRQVVAMSSGASVSGNRGWGGYAISKAALNMLMRLYSHEAPDTHFCSLAPGLIDTAMQDFLCALPKDDRYPSLEVLKAKRGTPDMPTPRAAAERLIEVFDRLPELVESGAFADVRKLAI